MAHRGGNSRRNQEIDTTITSVQCDGLVRKQNISVKLFPQKLKRKIRKFYIKFPNLYTVCMLHRLLFDVSTHVSLCVDEFYFVQQNM